MKPVAGIADEMIIDKIYHIRGLKVMLDRDLAEMYGVETRRLNEQVKRNIDRFPSDFMFQLTEQEFDILMSQIATSSWGGIRKMPFAQGTSKNLVHELNIQTSSEFNGSFEFIPR